MSLFNKKTEQKQEVQVANLSNTIGKGTVITGDIESYGNIRIEGKVIGNIHSKSKIVLGDGCIVEGNIIAQNAEIEGSVKGTLEIKDVLNLKSTASIDGDIHTSKLVTEPGARFNGKCHMIGEKGAAKQLNPASQGTLPKGNNSSKNGSHANKKKQPTYKLYLQYSGIGFQMMGAIAICAWLGHLLDEKLQTEKPFITIIAMLFGVGASIYLMIRSINKLSERLEKQKAQEKSDS